ncbi:bi-domain-containing oxidoreductase [Aquibium microcysteis]|uniref:bi-domain-containing oxidoreductase n=1 Tax=Aquibium microcysteis TaxID=675281 RepID=UPI00165D1216|nr:bi-domain-containing oxidoreductase [Aquibium microcysteis]
MKQILQSLRSGVTEVAEVPCPAVGARQVLIRTTRTLVSAGTERMLVDFGRAGLVGKARQQPERVRQVLAKMRTDGLAPTLEAVFSKLDQPLPLGYCNVGTVIEAGSGVAGLAPGDRVVSNGRHAEAVAVPLNLCARVPSGVSDDAAAFTVLGAIALQGIRLVQPTLGEAVVVTGLGLIGLMTVQLLRAHGCRVLGIDMDPAKLRLAESFGATTVDLAAGVDPVAAAEAFSRGRGVDAVIITASTKSSEPMHQAALMCRKRGRIVLVGVAGLELSRADFYEKELQFQVSCSYGPGRYDPDYEEKGQDYPVGFVRWTQQRNFEAVLDMLAEGRLDVQPLISHRFALDDAAEAYDLVTGGVPSLGILLDYPAAGGVPDAELTRRTVVLPGTAGIATVPGKAGIGFVGSGNYATGVLIPAFRTAGARLVCVASSAGVTGLHAGRKFGFEKTTTDAAVILDDPAVDAVVVATRHDSHASFACSALKAGKHVFVEKPLALTHAELERIEAGHAAAASSGVAPLLIVGFNRRFAPHVVKARALLAGTGEPKSFVMTVNAGAIPADHWTQDRATGGGRIVGEACHFIDLLRFLADAPIVSFDARAMAARTGDTASISLSFADGSLGTIHYFANGSRSFPKERLEIFSAGRILQLDNFRKLTGFGWKGFSRMSLWRQDKGQKACAAAFLRAIEGAGPPPIPLAETIEVARVSIDVAEALRP